MPWAERPDNPQRGVRKRFALRLGLAQHSGTQPMRLRLLQPRLRLLAVRVHRALPHRFAHELWPAAGYGCHVAGGFVGRGHPTAQAGCGLGNGRGVGFRLRVQPSLQLRQRQVECVVRVLCLRQHFQLLPQRPLAVSLQEVLEHDQPPDRIDPRPDEEEEEREVEQDDLPLCTHNHREAVLQAVARAVHRDTLSLLKNRHRHA
mmetsp:Transcript_21306/g.43227  ORF Transcript_21306/g.43227 Transcript_21306/m.43227 type:complete len:203 (+) Transcript_21306:1332-1940(+)